MHLPRRLPRLYAALLLLAFAAGARADGPDWPYRRLSRPPVPAARQRDQVRNPVDAFVLARLEKDGLRLAPAADRRTLLVRVTHDLTGLAPTPAELDAFLRDPAPDAYERVVERLLASPRFGERWAQHWLDVVRYSETEGFKIDLRRTEAHRYRDYVVRAFNADLPYDRFVRQQLAGDELEPDNPDALVATGFLRVHPEESNGSNYRQIRQEILDDITETTGLAFLGLTVGCARCHDHKFDPISQEDYFRFQAFFAGIVQHDEQPLAPRPVCQDYDRKMDSWQHATQPIRAEMDGMLKQIRADVFKEIVETFDPDTQAALNLPPEQRTAVQQQLALLGGKQLERRFGRMHRRLTPERRAHFDGLQKQLDGFDTLKPAPLPLAMTVTDLADPPKTHRLGGGDYRRPKEEVQPGFPECLETRDPDIRPPAAAPTSTGRRAALARWLTEPDHALTGRVMVNRLWAQYFGRGLVGTPNDFGKMGQAPTHPELLDYLAAELVRQGWSLKAVHRLIVTSATYRQDSAAERNPTAAAARKADPGNLLLWHARVRRRDAEAIRDVALQASGQLNLRMFGPSAEPELPGPLLENRYAWTADEDVRDRNRRSVYVFHRRTLMLPLLQAFDAPDRSGSCPSRPTTISAPQALVMLNGEFALTQARHLAGRLLAESHDPDHLVRRAYQEVLHRDPDVQEADQARRFLETQARHAPKGPNPEPLPPDMPAGPAAALVDLTHALLGLAEFLYVD